MRTRLFAPAFAAVIALGALMSAARADDARDIGRHSVAPFVTRPFPAMRPHPADLALKRGHVQFALREARPTRSARQFCCIFPEFPFDASVVSLGDEVAPTPETAVQEQAAVQRPVAPVAARARHAPSDETIGAVTILRGSGAP